MSKAAFDNISKEQALEIAKKECKNQGWVWIEPVVVKSHYTEWEISTHPEHRWVKAKFRISKATGEIKSAEYDSQKQIKQSQRGCIKTLIISSISLFVLFICYAMIRIVLLIPEIIDPPYEEFTYPLDEIIIQDLCAKFELSSKDPRCDSVGDVYAPEFFPEVYEFAEAGELSTFSDWEAMFEDYQTCDPIEHRSDGSGYFWCDYDFKGDFVYRIHVTFNNDESLFRVHYVTPDD